MQQQQGIRVYRFEYEIPNNARNPWIVHIAGYNQEECQNYLFSTMGQVKVTGISQECPLHAISNELRTKILEANKRKPGRPKKMQVA